MAGRKSYSSPENERGVDPNRVSDGFRKIRRARSKAHHWVKVASYNVNGVNGRLPRLLEWLAAASPDVACLQELKTDDSKFPISAIDSAGYGAIWHGQRSHHGVAILAKGETPVELRRGLPGDPADVQTRYLEAKAKGIVVSSIYLPNGKPTGSANFEYKLRWFGRFVEYATKLAKSIVPIVLAGDLNVVPTDFDIYNPGWWRGDAVMQPEARDAFGSLLALGWVDAARQLHPNERMYTYWTTENAFARNMGMRLDFMLLNGRSAALLTDAGVDTTFRGGTRPSDHAPVWIELNDRRLSNGNR
jgi:exodeoxyribonuclease-3